MKTLFFLSLTMIAGLASICSADTISLKGHDQPFEGQIVDETDRVFIIEVPKDQISQIVRGTPFSRRAPASLPKVLMEEQDGYLVIHIPQEQLERKGIESGTVLPKTVESFKPTENVPDIPPTQASRQFGSITGRVLRDGKLLADCRVKIVMVSSPQSPAMVAKLMGKSGEQTEIGYVTDVVTDASGMYRFERVPPGEYNVYWQPDRESKSQWVRRLSDKPDIVLLEGEDMTFKDIETHVNTVN